MQGPAVALATVVALALALAAAVAFLVAAARRAAAPLVFPPARGAPRAAGKDAAE